MISKLKARFSTMKNSFKHLKSIWKNICSIFSKWIFYFSGLIHNIAAKYGLELGQIAVSSVEQNGLTSFQIMPYFTENMDIFDKKMDQIDFDVMKNSDEQSIIFFCVF